MWKFVPAVENALRRGITAIPDGKRPHFYELEIGDHWYYLHFPARISGVFLVAVRRGVLEYSFADLVHDYAC
jgi:hypothetical protein